MRSVTVPKESDRHKQIVNTLRAYYTAAQKTLDERAAKWAEAEETMVGYLPESDVDRVRKNRRQDKGQHDYVTITLPYTYAAVMAAHAYWTTVFLARNPVYQFMGNNDEGEMQVQALEALQNYQMVKGRMLPQHYIWLQDVGKYGEAWISPYWTEQRSKIVKIEKVPELYLGMLQTNRMKTVRRAMEVVSYQGNQVYNIAPCDVLTDPRYPRGQFQKGEFVGIKTKVSGFALKAGEEQGRYFNLNGLPSRGTVSSLYGTNERSSNAEGRGLLRPDVRDLTKQNDNFVTDVFEVHEYVVTLVPSDWGLGADSMPQKWVLSVSADYSTLFECRPFGHFHDKYPLAYLEVEPEGYGKFSRSLIERFESVQVTLDWLINSHFHNVRQTLNNMFILDPSRIEVKDLTPTQPGAGMAIRLKPAAYGTDVRTALQQLATTDVTRSHLTDMQMMFEMGERLGANDTVMGLSAPSSRRTAQEIRGSQTFAVSQLKAMAEYFSATGFSDLSDMMIANTQQFYSAEMKVKLAGEAALMAGAEFLQVTPETIAGSYSYLPVDGTLPVDRYAQANLWRETIAQMAQVPQVMGQYDLGRIFAYTAQLMGLRNINRFKIQVLPPGVAPPQGMMPLQQTEQNMLEPGQVPGMGPTA